MNGEDENLRKVQDYRKVVLIYEALDAEIDRLIMDNGGGTEKMSSGDFVRYRELAQQRDEVFNQMRAMEQELLDEDI